MSDHETMGDALQADLLAAFSANVAEVETITAEAADPRNVDTFTKRVSLFARLEHARRKVEDMEKQISRVAKKLGAEILEDMSEEGMTKISSEGLTLYPLEKPYVSKRADGDGATKEALCVALKNNGLGFLVKNEDTYAPGTLKSAILEMLKDGKEVPPEVEKLLNIGKAVELTSRLLPKK